MKRMMDFAPGAPGIDARWTSSAKSAVGTALSTASPVWFTLSHGILNEIYYPRVDSACTRDFGFVVTGPDDYFSEEKRDCEQETVPIRDGVPAFLVVNTAKDGAYRIEKQIISDPARAAILQRVSFTALKGETGDYRVTALLAPHLVNAGASNSAWIGEYEGAPVLFASGRSRYLALVTNAQWQAVTAGFVGASDGWQQLHKHGQIVDQYQRADDGNVALAGEIDFSGSDGTAVLALGFGQTEHEAAAAATRSLKDGFDQTLNTYVAGWRKWQDGLAPLDRKPQGGINAYRVSTAVLATHRAADRPGAAVASLSIPWGFSKGDGDLGGYHLVWPRDLVETAGGFLAAGDAKEARAILDYLRELQEPSGRWAQNFWLDGKPYWPGVQMDECAFPILLADMLRRNGHLKSSDLRRFLPMIKNAAGYILANGPSTAEDRWEEDAGYSPFTLAAEITALLGAADMLEDSGETKAAAHLRETADCWNEQIEKWTFEGDPDLCRELDISGYYVRIAAPGATDTAGPDGKTPIRNQTPDHAVMASDAVISSGCAGTGALRAARGGRPPYRGYRQGNRPHAARGTAARPALVSLHRDGYGEQRTASLSTASERDAPGPYWPVSAPITSLPRADPTRPRPCLKRSKIGQCRRVAPGAKLGRARHAGAGALFRPALRQRDAAGLGAFGAYQILRIACRWRPCSTCRRKAGPAISKSRQHRK